MSLFVDAIYLAVCGNIRGSVRIQYNNKVWFRPSAGFLKIYQRCAFKGIRRQNGQQSLQSRKSHRRWGRSIRYLTSKLWDNDDRNRAETLWTRITGKSKRSCQRSMILSSATYSIFHGHGCATRDNAYHRIGIPIRNLREIMVPTFVFRHMTSKFDD